MFVEELRRAAAAAPRAELHHVCGALWKAHAAGAIGDDDAQQLAEEIERRKRDVAPPAPRRRVGSRPRTVAGMDRRRRWVSAGLMPPQVAAAFTMGEAAALAVIATEVMAKGACRLTLNHIAAIAGVCRSTVRNAVREAVRLGLVRSEEWRLSAFRNAPNTVSILSPEWSAWLRHRRIRGGCGQNRTAHAHPTITEGSGSTLDQESSKEGRGVQSGNRLSIAKMVRPEHARMGP